MTEPRAAGDRPAAINRYAILNRETGQEVPIDVLPIEHGDLIVLRSDPPLPPDASEALRAYIEGASGKEIVVAVARPDWNFEVMSRAQQEALLARLQKHLADTWSASGMGEIPQ